LTSQAAASTISEPSSPPLTTSIKIPVYRRNRSEFSIAIVGIRFKSIILISGYCIPLRFSLFAIAARDFESWE